MPFLNVTIRYIQKTYSKPYNEVKYKNDQYSFIEIPKKALKIFSHKDPIKFFDNDNGYILILDGVVMVLILLMVV